MLATLVYLSALDNPFVYDDFRLIVENPSILNPWDLQTVIVRDITRPVVNLSYAVDTMLWGQHPVGYHVTNLLLHVANVVLVFWVALLASEDRKRQTGQRVGAGASPTVIACAAATLFAVHPMMTQAVGYISGRSEVAYAAFFLLAFLAGRRWMLGGGTRWWVACVGLWALAILTKESAALLPVVLLAYDRFVLDADGPERRRRFLRLELPMLAATFVAGAGRVAVLRLVEYPDQAGPSWRLVLIAVDAFWQYLAFFFVPRGQSIFHAPTPIDSLFSLRALAGVVGLAGFVALAWALRRVHSVMTVGLLWFALLLVPSGVLFILGRGEPVAEHRAYLSAAGLFLTWGCAFGVLWARTGRGRALLAVTTAVILAQLSFQTIIRNVIWQDPVMLSREATSLAPGHWMPRILLAESLRQNGRCTDAVSEYRAAIAIRPRDEFPYTRLARCLIEGQRLAEAEEALRQLHSVNSTSTDASLGLGVFALLGGRLDESREHFQEVLTQEPGRARAKLMLAFIEGTLPAVEHQRMCKELQIVAGGPLTIDACRTDTPQGGSDSAVTSLN
ncbi:MAG: tetratricopeptide repeat protein [Vicinamibacterales bacterium]